MFSIKTFALFYFFIFQFLISIKAKEEVCEETLHSFVNTLELLPEVIRFQYAGSSIVECPFSSSSEFATLLLSKSESSIKVNDSIRLYRLPWFVWWKFSIPSVDHSLKYFLSGKQTYLLPIESAPGQFLICKNLPNSIALMQLSKPSNVGLLNEMHSQFKLESFPISFKSNQIYPPRVVQKEIDQDVELSCLAPIPYQKPVIYEWFKDDQLIVKSSTIRDVTKYNYNKLHYKIRKDRLTISYLQEEDDGLYTCSVYNQYGRNNASTYLKIKKFGDGKPKISNCTTEQTNQIVSLSCFISSKEPVRTMWIKQIDCETENCDNASEEVKLYKLKDHFYQKVSKPSILNRLMANGKSSTLLIKDAKPEDQGVYACLTTNSVGFQFALVNFTLTKVNSNQLISKENSKTNHLLTLISGCVFVSLAIFTLLLKCFLYVRRRKQRRVDTVLPHSSKHFSLSKSKRLNNNLMVANQANCPPSISPGCDLSNSLASKLNGSISAFHSVSINANAFGQLNKNVNQSKLEIQR